MPRTWLSIPILRTGIRIGRSWADADLRPRLPAWRKWELRRGLQDAAKARGEKMTEDEAAYCVDKAVDIGGIEIVEEEIQAVSSEEAEAVADKAIAATRSPFWWILATLGVVIFLLLDENNFTVYSRGYHRRKRRGVCAPRPLF